MSLSLLRTFVDIRIYYSNLSEERYYQVLAKSQSHLTTEIYGTNYSMELSERKSVAKCGGTVFQGIKHGLYHKKQRAKYPIIRPEAKVDEK